MKYEHLGTVDMDAPVLFPSLYDLKSYMYEFIDDELLIHGSCICTFSFRLDFYNSNSEDIEHGQ